MFSDSQLECLKPFGFSDIEARVYRFLLTESPATGYRISHAIGKAAANTYKAISALEQKGAVIVENGENRLCRAVPLRELLDGLTHAFEADCDTAERALADLSVEAEDHRVYQLTTVEQVMARARAMLASAQEVALLDVTPLMAEALSGDISAAKKRGVRVGAVLYSPDRTLASNTALVSHHAKEILTQWPGEHVNLVIDASESLLAVVTPDRARVIQAVWTNSNYLSVFYHNGIVFELTAFAMEAHAPGAMDAAGDVQNLSLTIARPKGFRDFLQSVGTPIQLKEHSS